MYCALSVGRPATLNPFSMRCSRTPLGCARPSLGICSFTTEKHSMRLRFRAAIGTLIEKWRDLGHDLGFGIGIAHGFATLGTIGFEGRFDYAAIGTVSNVASRLCDEAKPGQILISPRVRQAVEKAVTVEPVGEFALKGIRRPMMTYNVLEPLPSKPNCCPLLTQSGHGRVTNFLMVRIFPEKGTST